MESYDEMQVAAAEKGSGVTTEMVNQARAMWLMAQIEYEKGTTNNKALIQQWEAEINSLLANSGGPEAAAQEGAETGAGYASGVESQTDEAYSSGEALSKSANEGASSTTGYDAGYSFGSGFVSGINEWVGSAIAAGVSLGAEALAATKKEINSNSPSKETMKLGKYFGQGFELGISGEEKAVGRASERLANTALKSLDMAAISSRMRESMALNTNRVARSMALESRSTILSKQQTEMLMRMSDADIERLALRMGRITADEVSKKQNSRPIYLGTERIDKPLPKGAVPRI